MSEVREGYKMTELGEIPSEWEVKSIGDFIFEFRGGASIKPVDFSNEGIKVLPKKIVDDNSQKMLDSLERISYLRSEDFKKSKVNSKFLITSLRDLVPTAPSLGKIVKLKVNEQIEFLLAQGVYGFQVNDDLDENFLIQFSHSDIYRKKIQELKVGSTQVHMRQGDFLELKLPYPQVIEQQKIASILSTLDEQIDETEQLIVKTKELKKGLMQQLLTKGIGHTEFKQTELGEIPKEWKVIQLGDLSNIHRGASPRPIKDPKWFSDKSSHGWIRISDVTKSKKYLYETEQYLSEEGIKKSRTVAPGDLIMSICGTIGRPIILKINACIHDGFVAFESLKKDIIDTEYLRYYLLTLIEYFKSQGQPGTQVNLNTSIVEKALIALPPLVEQQKISQILSTVDAQIEEYEEEKAKYEELKKGLMQRLLTGQIRVKI